MEISDLMLRLDYQLVACDTSLSCAREIYQKLKHYEPTDIEGIDTFANNSKVIFWSNIGNLYFQDAVLLLGSILEKKGNPQEISITTLLLSQAAHSASYFQLQQKFNNSTIKTLRDKQFAHKDLDGPGSSLKMFYDVFQLNIVNEAEEFLKSVKTFCNELFPVLIHQNLNPLSDKVIPELKEEIGWAMKVASEVKFKNIG